MNPPSSSPSQSALQGQSGQSHDAQTKSDTLYRIRHSLAHIMAEAVLEIRPGSKLGFGPPIDDGFYYDFILSSPITEEDFPQIEKKMRQLIQAGHAFVREELSCDAALQRIEEMGEPYKKEYAKELIQKKSLSNLTFYRTGPFLDMCDGPHVETSRNLPAMGFKLRSVAGAYWRGNSDNAMMTRIYAWAFATQAELDAYAKAFKEAQERDHKKLGKELEIFVIDDIVGKGLPLWLPNGTVIRDELEKLAKEMEFKGGYHRVATPHLARAELYYQTGHLPYYAGGMYPIMEVKETVQEGTGDKSQASASDVGSKQEIKEAYCLRPMNCPHHHRIFASQIRSYRQLPLRLAEYGQVYRFEDSGALSGLLRVRGMCQNDAHIYCTEEQIKSEFLNVMNLHRDIYEVLNIKAYTLRFSTWDPEDPKGKEKYINNPAEWEKTQKLVYEAMVDSGLPFYEGKGEAAFYGPKIDMQLKTVTGREETASTNQLDFGVPGRLGLKYVGADNQEHTPYVIHRAPLGTHERFTAFLIEHFGGAFPTWLAPIQTRVITVGEKFDAYGQRVVQELRSLGIRAELEQSSDTMGKKIRNGVKQKIPNLLILGDREQTDGTVTLRRYGSEKQTTLSVAAFQEKVQKAIQKRSDAGMME